MPDSDRRVVDWPPPRRPARRVGGIVFLVLLAAMLFGGRTTLTFYVDALWFESLGFADVFWTTLNVQTAIFLGFAAVTFLILYGSYVVFKPARLGEIAGGNIIINGQPLRLPVEPVLRLMALGLSIGVALISGAGMMAQWTTLALGWYGRSGAATLPASTSTLVDPIFGRPVTFYLFTLPAAQLVANWLLTLALLVAAIAAFFVIISGGTRLLGRRRPDTPGPGSWRGLSIAIALLLVMFAARVYLARFAELLDDSASTIFSGVTYTDANVTLTGMLIVSGALAAGALIALINAVAAPKLRWIVAAFIPAAVCYAGVGVVGWYVNSFIVRPNELVREAPYITHNIESTRQAFALTRLTPMAFPAETGLEAVEAASNRATLDNIRLWDWRALQDTLRQIQEIRTYYDFPDIDIDRYEINGQMRQVMLATRELSLDKLPVSSRNWINEKLIYTHGYGVTMNPVNGFTPDGLPTLLLSDMPVKSTVPGLSVTRPEIYFGELTNQHVYVRTRQKEFNYPEGDTNSETTYEGEGGIALGGLLRRLAISAERGDVTRLPFSDDISAESRLLMRRNIRERLTTLAPYLILDPDPYIVIGEDGRLSWMIDAYTASAWYPYARRYLLGRDRINYLRNSVKAVIDAYDGTTTFYVFDSEDPIIAAYRAIFPSLYKDASAMPADLRKHVRYPELMLEVQAAVYGLYHMTDPGVFYNREDLWTVASEVGSSTQRGQAAQPMEPNLVLMTLPGETRIEFIEILPFTPANRNNLIGWIAGRSDEPNYGTAIVYDFPKTRLVDGPLQIEARIDQDAQLSSQLSLWDQQGSSVLRGSLIVIPIGRALLYAEPIYLQADRSPMPQLRLVVLALQDRLAYGPTFEAAMASLFSGAPSALASTLPTGQAGAPAAAAARATAPATGAAAPSGDTNALIAAAARDLADYQRLTAEGRLGEAGQRLESLKRTLEVLASRR